MGYLNREEAPLTQEEWGRLDEIVTKTARGRLVGRRFIKILGPIGAGVQVVGKSSIGEEEGVVAVSRRVNLTIPLIYKDFKLRWRDIEESRKMGFPLDLGPAAMAAALCAEMEDRLIFRGCAHEGETGCECPGEGLLTVEGRNELESEGWEEPGSAFRDAVAAVERLISSGCYGPYAMVVSPSAYAKLHRMMERGARLEINFIRELMEGRVYQSPILTEKEGIVVATAPENLDLVVGQDLITAYLGPEGMDHLFRAMEAVLLRIKRPEAICAIRIGR